MRGSFPPKLAQARVPQALLAARPHRRYHRSRSDGQLAVGEDVRCDTWLPSLNHDQVRFAVIPRLETTRKGGSGISRWTGSLIGRTAVMTAASG